MMMPYYINMLDSMPAICESHLELDTECPADAYRTLCSAMPDLHAALFDKPIGYAVIYVLR